MSYRPGVLVGRGGVERDGVERDGVDRDGVGLATLEPPTPRAGDADEAPRAALVITCCNIE